MCKFTPLGFETCSSEIRSFRRLLCKFTPLGFETRSKMNYSQKKFSVNLPRWGLKLLLAKSKLVI